MSNKRKITYKCPYCDKRFDKENLVIHVGDSHDEMIPENYSAFRLVFDYVTKKPAGYNGKCIICGKETGWDETKGKYNRLCNNPACKKKYIQSFEERMMKSKGVTRISSTAEGQAKMLANRKISGEYKFQDGGIRTYTGTYEKKAIEFMDKVMNIQSIDVTTPGPIMEYDFDGKKHIYISDIYYAPYNLIIEVKDGGNNPNMRSMPEYRAKQIAKEKYIIKNTDYNYLRLTNNDFSQLLSVFMQLKMEMSNDTPDRVIRINEAYTGELGKIQKDPEIIDSYGFISSDGIYNENVKIKGFNKWLRGRSELLIIDKDKLYLKKDSKKGYSIPGGGWEKDEDHNLSAIRETNEEARIKVKNVSYVCSYASFFDPKDWVKEKISEENWWYGEYTELYIGEYDGQYKGEVDKIDQDKAMESGKFYDIKSIYNDLIPVHQEALSSIINESMGWKESKIKEDTNMTEAMNALMTGYIPGSVDNPNNVYIVNYMQNNVFSDEDPNEDCIGVSDNIKLTNLIVRDNTGMLKRVDESFLKDKDYKVYILEISRDEVNEKLGKYLGGFVKKNFIYETLTGHKLYTKDQIQFESAFIPTLDYYKYMETFREICDNYFLAKDKKEIPVNESTFIPKEVRYFNKSGLMYSEKIHNLDEYINSKPNKVLEYLDIIINN